MAANPHYGYRLCTVGKNILKRNTPKMVHFFSSFIIFFIISLFSFVSYSSCTLAVIGPKILILEYSNIPLQDRLFCFISQKGISAFLYFLLHFCYSIQLKRLRWANQYFAQLTSTRRCQCSTTMRSMRKNGQISVTK